MSIGDIEFSNRKSLELDFHEIDEKLNSEIPLDIKHHIDNLLSLIKATLEKLQISLILPNIVDNSHVLHQYLNNKNHENCLQLIEEYKKQKNSKSSQEEQPHYDYQLIQIIDYFQENHKILNLLPNWLDDINDTEKFLLTAFENVYKIAKEKLHTSATAVLAKEKRLHEVYLANEEVKQQINEMLHRIETKKINRLWKHAGKSGIIKNLENELTFQQYDINMIIKREKLKSQQQIQQLNNVFTVKQQELKDELHAAHLNYKKKLSTNLVNEKNIRDERNKLQLQLDALIAKYHQIMHEKHLEEISLQKEYEKEQQDFDNFLKDYKKEEAIYEELVGKKKREYKSLHEAKIRMFTYVCAAKKIAKWWMRVQEKTNEAAGNGKTKSVAAKKNQSGKKTEKKNQNLSASQGKKKIKKLNI